MSEEPRFLSDNDRGETTPARQPPDVTSPTTSKNDEDLPRGPVLLEAEPNVPSQLGSDWMPEEIVTPRQKLGTASWIAGGIGILLLSWAAFSILSFLLAQFQYFWGLGILATISVAMGVGMVAYAVLIEWRAYRSLAEVYKLRAKLIDQRLPVEAVRSASLDWLARIGSSVPDAAAVASAIREAEKPAHVRAILRNRLAGSLRDSALQIGRRAAIDGAALVAVCPSPAWDGLIAGARGLLVIRRVATLYGVRPGLVPTIALMRHVAATAAGSAAVGFLAQELANHTLQELPVIKHIVGAVPEAGVAALRLYRLAGVTARACCPLSDRTDWPRPR